MRLKLTFQVDPQLLPGIARLERILSFTQGDGILVTARESDRTGVSLENGTAVITYSRKHLFFRWRMPIREAFSMWRILSMTAFLQ